MNKKYIILLVVGVLSVFAVGYWLGTSTDQSSSGKVGQVEKKVDFWTCSMHPQIRLPKPGLCPLCPMELIPVTKSSGNEDLGPRQLHLSETARRMAQVRVAPVERKFLTTLVRMVGKVEYDETRLAYITTRVPGRLDRLYVDYTGVPVKKGDHLVDIYSPDLITAQEELIQSLATARKLQDSSLSLIRERAQATVESARERLRLWGLTPEQVREIEQSGVTSDHLIIYAPVSGIVVHMEALEGKYVTTGSQIYTIADLSQVWIKLDAYESDLAWIRYGQEVSFETEAYPGEVYTGRISFIDPVLDPQTRTVKVRVNVDNARGRLKPEMFVSAVVRSQLADHGLVIDESLAGKWISPMHPEIVKDGPGDCDICGMALVKAEDLGFIPSGGHTNMAPLTVPASAPLITGQRAVVYVALTNRPGVYEGRDIVLGHRAGEDYMVREGLSEGELVVVNGNFKIDSAIQIQAGPSMMNPEGGGPLPGHAHGHDHGKSESSSASKMVPVTAFPGVPELFQQQLAGLIPPYLVLQQALSHDQWNLETSGLPGLISTLEAVDMGLLKEAELHQAWMDQFGILQVSLEKLKGAVEIKQARTLFEPLSQALIIALKQFGQAGDAPLYMFHCPMALGGQGANWLQDKHGTENPYYGSKMFACGDEMETLVPVSPVEDVDADSTTIRTNQPPQP